MNPILSFVAASALAGLDLGILALATKKLGGAPSKAALAGLSLAVMLKLAVLVAGAAWMSRQPWNDKRAMLAGLLAPFLIFIAWQALRLQLRAGKRA